MELQRGIEPRYLPYQSSALPLSDCSVVGTGRNLRRIATPLTQLSLQGLPHYAGAP